MPFLNIFSNKRENIVKKKIIVDNRERNSLVPPELIKLGLEIDWQQLPVADYLLNDLFIERKTFADLQSSIINKRIISQIEELKKYPSKLIIIEGYEKYPKILHENAIRGLLLNITLNNNIPIIYTSSEHDTACFINLLSSKKSNNFSLRPSKTPRTKKEQILFILEGFPNIGPKTAEKLLNGFGSIQNIINASEEELQNLIGKKAQNLITLRN